MLELILSVSLAVLISAYCSITEAILYSVPWSFIERLRSSGKKSGELLYKLRLNVEEPITAVLTLNTVANTAGAAVAGAAFADVFGQKHMATFAAGFTLVILIFSEIIPKTLGVSYAKPLAPVMAAPLRALVLILRPVIIIGGKLTNLLTPESSGPHATEDDIRAIVSLSRRTGAIKPYEETSIKNILMLDRKRVHDIMTPRTVTFSLHAEMSVEEARLQSDFWHYSRIPVFDENNEDMVGIVLRRSVLEELAADRHKTKLSEIMRPVHFVLESVTLDKLLGMFLEVRTHLFVVLDEYGGLAGVVSLEDVMEEILGKEIVDETDRVEDMRQLARRRRSQTSAQTSGQTSGQASQTSELATGLAPEKSSGQPAPQKTNQLSAQNEDRAGTKAPLLSPEQLSGNRALRSLNKVLGKTRLSRPDKTIADEHTASSPSEKNNVVKASSEADAASVAIAENGHTRPESNGKASQTNMAGQSSPINQTGQTNQIGQTNQTGQTGQTGQPNRADNDGSSATPETPSASDAHEGETKIEADKKEE